MVERSYSNAELVEIIREALARTPGRAAHRELADGFDLATAFYALRHSRAEVSPVDPRSMDPDVVQQQQRRKEARAEALPILRAALAPTGPFTTIPKLGRNFHIRMGRDGGMEVITDNGILAGRDIVLQRVDKHPGGRPAVPKELIEELDREACATLAAGGDPLKKSARADLIQRGLAEKGINLAQRTIENMLKAKRH